MAKMKGNMMDMNSQQKGRIIQDTCLMSAMMKRMIIELKTP